MSGKKWTFERIVKQPFSADYLYTCELMSLLLARTKIAQFIHESTFLKILRL